MNTEAMSTLHLTMKQDVGKVGMVQAHIQCLVFVQSQHQINYQQEALSIKSTCADTVELVFVQSQHQINYQQEALSIKTTCAGTVELDQILYLVASAPKAQLPCFNAFPNLL